MKGREAVLNVFDRLFEQAAKKLDVDCDTTERNQAREQFAERFSFALTAADEFGLDAIPESVTRNMENAIDSLSPAQIAGHLASVPIAHHAQQLLQSIAVQAAQQKVLRHIIDQADDHYGGN